MQGKYLISTDTWFYAPDGKQYKAAWGDVQIVEDTFLGLKTNRNSSNWFAKVGSEQNHIIIGIFDMSNIFSIIDSILSLFTYSISYYLIF
jgi:hypothetical protein